jgi:hypothetical protein
MQAEAKVDMLSVMKHEIHKQTTKWIKTGACNITGPNCVYCVFEYLPEPGNDEAHKIWKSCSLCAPKTENDFVKVQLFKTSQNINALNNIMSDYRECLENGLNVSQFLALSQDDELSYDESEYDTDSDEL